MVPNPSMTGLAPTKGANTPALITIPAPNRATTRRSAQNPSVSISAFVVRDKHSHNASNVSVSLKRNDRFMGLTLKGHVADVVDLEFLCTTPRDEVHVLATCDTDGVVYLWFLYVAIDALGIDIGLRLLKKYSFYSLRRSTSAFYSRIRLAGSIENGTMILVPNDGSNCRVVSFNCKTSNPKSDEQLPAIEAPPEHKLLMPPPPHASHDEYSAKHTEFNLQEHNVQAPAPQGKASAVEGNTVAAAEQLGMDRVASMEVVPTASSIPLSAGMEDELVPAEGKHATEALTAEPKPFVAPTQGATQSKAEESVSEEFVDAISNVIVDEKQKVGEKVLAEEDKVKNVPQAEAVVDYGDLREIDGSEDDGRGDEFADPEVELGKIKGRMDDGYEAEGEFEAGEFGRRVDVAVGGFERGEG
eukprot:TRINITY_DN434_c0_g1_i1.p2 TRINITY_DN434_c0_g1~~TRINITY_DN434_c0_g1_i1.p2  ORF type:complete len:415 (-),score=89.19 TRINITY_DN434_c0_g1_i1:10913-12157(-)